MPKIGITYLEDGEFLSINTNLERGGSVIGIEPESQHVIAIKNPSGGLVRTIRPGGHFKFNAPYDDRLNDWGLQLSGVPRIYDRIKFDVVSALMGEEVSEQIQQYHRDYGVCRESVGDLIAKHMFRTPMTLDEGFEMMKPRTLEVSRDINAEAHEARARLLEQAVEDSGRLVIARSVLIADID